MKPGGNWNSTRLPGVSCVLILAIFVLLNLATRPATAQTYTELYAFRGNGNGTHPIGVTRGSKGDLYGTTEGGGAFGFGTVFKLDHAGKETVLHSFTGADGLYPNVGPVRDEDDNIYGTTYEGGTPEGGKCKYGCGTVFKVDPRGRETVLHAFAGGNRPGNPGQLVRSYAGDLYGVAEDGKYGNGVVFEVSKAGNFAVLYSFRGQHDGEGPNSLVLAEDGTLYGTAAGGGINACEGLGCGVVFKLSRRANDRWRETVLYSFTNTADGWYPAHLALDGAGNLYGTAQGGNQYCEYEYCDLVFELDTHRDFKVLHDFTGYPSDGSYPDALVSDQSGNLYGTTDAGGSSENCGQSVGCGTIFSLDSSGNETILHNFVGNDGATPFGLIIDRHGVLYGTTIYGGSPVDPTRGGPTGVVFRLVP